MKAVRMFIVRHAKKNIDSVLQLNRHFAKMLQSYFWIIAFQECAFIERQKGIFVEKKMPPNFFCSQSVFVLLWIERRMEGMRWMMFLLSIITYLLADEKRKVEKNTLLKILSRV